MITTGADDLISWVFKGIITIVVGVVGFVFKKRADGIDDTLDKHDDQITVIDKAVVKLRADSVSEAKVREIVKTEFATGLSPVVLAIEEMKEGMKSQEQATQSLLLAIAEQKGYNEAMKEFGK